jgi:membrane protease YdiL (CAAX protease family)
MGGENDLWTGRVGPDLAPRFRTALALAFAMSFPTLLTWLYFLLLATGGGPANPAQQLAYAAGKCIQFGFPLAFVWLSTGRRPRSQRPHFEGLALALSIGLLVAAAMLALYFAVLRNSSLLAQTPLRVRHKLEELGANSTGGYVALATFIVVGHSLLEEYYWRWFVFGGLRRLLPLVPALALASLAFMAHHVILLSVYLPGKFWTAALPFSLVIAVGGAVWAWIYERAGSLCAPWLSHLLVDAAIFVIGWDLLQRAGG